MDSYRNRRGGGNRDRDGDRNRNKPERRGPRPEMRPRKDSASEEGKSTEPNVRPVILAKPHRTVADNPEEWPAIDAAAWPSLGLATAAPQASVWNKNKDINEKTDDKQYLKDFPAPGTTEPIEIKKREKSREDSQGTNSPETSRRTLMPPRGRSIQQSDAHTTKPTLAAASKLLETQGTSRRDPKIGDDIWEKSLSSSVRLINENLEWADEILEFLSGDLSSFQVIGAIGPQSTGKSTLLSMIGGNDPFDMYRQYIFRPASREATEGVKHQTLGIQVYVTKSRTVLLDCQPFLSSAVLDEQIRYKGRYHSDLKGCKTVEQLYEIESLSLLSFMMLVCHTVLLVTDWFVDLNMIRFIRTADMLRPDPPAAEGATQIVHRVPNFVFVQQRCQIEDYNLQLIAQRSRMLEKLFKGTKLNVKGHISMQQFAGYYPQFDHPSFANAAQINYVLLPEMKLKGQKDDDAAYQPGVPEYEILIEQLRIVVRSMPRPIFTEKSLTEKNWYQYAMKAWDLINKSGLFADYRKLL